MAAATLQPAAGAAGELTGLLLMRAWHEAQGSTRTKVIIPDSAHGTNPASVTLGGYEVVTVPSDERGLRRHGRAARTVLDEDVAGIMLTNPNTLGLFEEDIAAIAAAVHEVGGLLYYDGANLNAILGVVRPGDMGFDIVHMNLHKTFATPHGGGGPGRRPGGRVRAPGPLPSRPAAGAGGLGRRTPVFGWATPDQSHRPGAHLARQRPGAGPGPGLHPGQRGRRPAPGRRDAPCSTPTGSASGCRRPTTCPSTGPACTRSCSRYGQLKQAHGVRALDVAKRLLEEGFHAPTVYFPLIVDEALMIEPTETESPQTLEALAESLERIADEAATGPRAPWPSPPVTPRCGGWTRPGRPGP